MRRGGPPVTSPEAQYRQHRREKRLKWALGALGVAVALTVGYVLLPLLKILAIIGALVVGAVLLLKFVVGAIRYIVRWYRSGGREDVAAAAETTARAAKKTDRAATEAGRTVKRGSVETARTVDSTLQKLEEAQDE